MWNGFVQDNVGGQYNDEGKKEGKPKYIQQVAYSNDQKLGFWKYIYNYKDMLIYNNYYYKMVVEIIMIIIKNLENGLNQMNWNYNKVTEEGFNEMAKKSVNKNIFELRQRKQTYWWRNLFKQKYCRIHQKRHMD
ncbi:unnamed protein product [Paramecium sonneborni]|uniref:Uncharacterized protein n=1 Tax=Paramecium sonneborni TaxID=65129 RepID=A0A8S1Q3J1_9CILI|nr:unnamed protein product [Paramecium sonneborni]